MPVHLEVVELKEVERIRAANGSTTVSLRRIGTSLGARSLPAEVELDLAVHFRTEPNSEVPIALEVLAYDGAVLVSQSTTTSVAPTGQARLLLPIRVRFDAPGHYTVHCMIDETSWSHVIAIEAA